MMMRKTNFVAVALVVVLAMAAQAVLAQTTKADPVPHPLQNGRVPLPQLSGSTPVCKEVVFPEPFHSDEISLDDMQVIVNVAHPDWGAAGTHDAVSAWVEDVNFKSFTFCVRETVLTPGWTDNEATVEWMALGGTASVPFAGQAGKVTFGEGLGVQCKDVKFDTPLTEGAPVVALVTPNRLGSTTSRGAVSAWVTSASVSGLTVCLRADDGQNAATVGSVAVSYLVFTNDINEEAKVQGGVISGASLKAYTTLGHPQWCGDVKFTTKFPSQPWVIVSGTAGKTPVKAWVEDVSTGGARVCVASLTDETLPSQNGVVQINWAAVDPTYQVKVTEKYTAGKKGVRGDTGANGDAGAEGEQGAAGRKGLEGFRGYLGARGDAGQQGDLGETGPKGNSGPEGDLGELGPRGDKGSEGPEGFPGKDEFTGPRGPQGPRGDVGPMGPKGDEGPAGDQGEEGEMGIRGQPGPLGARGEQGAKGDAGVEGTVGPMGPAGELNYEASVVGPDGDQGEIGPVGPAGPLRTGVAGDQGPPGPRGFRGNAGVRGERGQIGIKGIRGEQGPVGVIGVIGEKGVKGYEGIVGLRGLVGSRGISGPQGPPGAEGNPGLAGPKGSKGQPGPRGDRGLTGPQGKPGPNGPRGMPGPTGVRGAQGPDGDRGVRGVKGLPGVPGPIGPAGDKGESGELGPKGPRGEVGFPGIPGRRSNEPGPPGPDGIEGIQGVVGEMGPQGIQGPVGRQGDDGADANGATVFYRMMSGAWLKDNAVFYDEDLDKNVQGTTLVVTSRHKARKIFGIPIFAPGKVKPNRHYTVRVRFAAQPLDEGADIFLGFADGFRIAGFRREDKTQRILARYMLGTKKDILKFHNATEDVDPSELKSVGETGYTMSHKYLSPLVAREAYELGSKLEAAQEEARARAVEKARANAAADVLVEDADEEDEIPEPPRDPKVTVQKVDGAAASSADASASASASAAASEEDKPKAGSAKANVQNLFETGNFTPIAHWTEIFFRFDTEAATEVLVKVRGEYLIYLDQLPFVMTPQSGLTLLCFADDPLLRYAIHAIEVEAHEETP
eukprot:comp21796_c0_seq3/m.48950 comp21796_c0_seq3/g.48950  ORF comp21796_c0_seq3/g.48950 comp21796_c0_seq3/m.48950 type:complete len:1062 (-) comp21796_c0_seq3:157-3342(-)